MDKIILENMQFYGYHGALTEENRLGQRFTVSLIIGTDTKAAAKNDDLTQTVNYAEIHAAVKNIMEGAPVKLLETLAETIAAKILCYGALSVQVTVKKIHPPISGLLEYAAVQIERRRQ